MQHTSKYQFNLVDATDDFSPTPLNQNMEKVEEELAGLNTALAQGLEEAEGSVAALEDSVGSQLAAVMANLGAAGKNARIAWGTYTGTGTYGPDHPTSLTFDFTPVALFLGAQGESDNPGWPSVYLKGCPTSNPQVQYSGQNTVTWQTHGITWYFEESPIYQNNGNGYQYYYVVLGYDDTAEG